MCWNLPCGVTYILSLRAIVKGINGLSKSRGLEFWMSLVGVVLVLGGFILFLLKMLFL